MGNLKLEKLKKREKKYRSRKSGVDKKVKKAAKKKAIDVAVEKVKKYPKDLIDKLFNFVKKLLKRII